MRANVSLFSVFASFRAPVKFLSLSVHSSKNLETVEPIFMEFKTGKFFFNCQITPDMVKISQKFDELYINARRHFCARLKHVLQNIHRREERFRQWL
jgi:hypothetical protein